MKIRKIGDRSPTPNQRIAIGIHAIGEIGRSIWKIGLSVRNAPPTQPIQRPSGTRDQKRQPEADADAEQRGSDVLPQGAVLRELAMPRRRLATASERSRCRSARRRSTRPRSGAAITSSGGAILVSVATTCAHRLASMCRWGNRASCHRVRQPAQAPAQRLPPGAGVGSTITLSCPLACAVHAKL